MESEARRERVTRNDLREMELGSERTFALTKVRAIYNAAQTALQTGRLEHCRYSCRYNFEDVSITIKKTML